MRELKEYLEQLIWTRVNKTPVLFMYITLLYINSLMSIEVAPLRIFFLRVCLFFPLRLSDIMFFRKTVYISLLLPA